MDAIGLAERGWVPAPAVRLGIRRLLKARLAGERRRQANREAALSAWIAELRESPVAPLASAANRQHYEVPAAFFEAVLGRHLKYSCALWGPGTRTLDEAEEAMLELTCGRAELRDGQRVLELGCGWGSLSLWMAARYPRSRITAVSNSRTQRAFVEGRAAQRGLANLAVVTADMNDYSPPPGERFDRVVSVEMFEHMRNWPELLRRVASWLLPAGKLFVHVFAHRRYAYPFEVDGQDDWMARHFFTGGMMPSTDLLPRLASPFAVEQHWVVPGTHYASTAEAWYERLVARRAEVEAALLPAVPPGEAGRQYHRWRLFMLACAELFGFDGGREWVVSHYRLALPAGGSDR